MIGSSPTTANTRPPGVSCSMNRGGNSGVEPVSTIASYVSLPKPRAPSPSCTRTLANPCRKSFARASAAVAASISTLAANQLQAMQMTFFFFLPTMLLSGFMFPFRGMPGWAQAIGNALPATYFMRLVRGILLKGNGWTDLWPNIWPMMVFTVVVMGFAVAFYRKTLD